MATPFDTPTRDQATGGIVDPASDKQIKFIASLLSRRDWTSYGNAKYVSRAADLMVAIDAARSKVDMHHGRATNIELANQGHDPLSRSGASAMIDWLLDAPERPETPAADPGGSLEGFWVIDGDVVKVQMAVHGSGQPYAKRLDAETGKFVYERGLIREVTGGSAARLTLERAKELGHLYGRCMCCGATLTNEDSIEAGIGPICSSKL